MILKLDLDILNQEENFRGLDHLMHVLESGQHELWFMTDQMDKLFESNWFNSLGERLQDITYQLFEKSSVNSSFISKHELQQRGFFQIVSDNGNLRSLANSLKTLDDHCFIIVEDIENDQLFIRRLLDVYRNAGKSIKKAIDRGWLQFSHSGGKTRTPKVIENHLSRKQQPYQPRAVVVIDSDKKHIHHAVSVETQQVIDICQANDLEIHIYEKREIENYIPDAVLRRKIPIEFTTVTEAYCAMSALQKDFFDLENGFANQRPGGNDPLYANYHTGDPYHALKTGFQHRDFNAKKEIVKFVEDVEFNQVNLQERCRHQADPDELKTLLKKINKLL